jgi:pyruvate kinase
MIEHPRPTRAEASDVANAILDGSDAVMLSGETAVGKYPLQAVEAIASIGREIERSGFLERGPRYLTSPGLRKRGGASRREHAIAAATVDSVRQIGGPAIIVITRSGFSARLVSSYRPAVPVFAVTTDPATYRQLGAVWGVRPVLAEGMEISYSSLAAYGMEKVKESGVGEAGSSIAITAGFPFHESGSTNNMRLDTL